MNLGVPCAEPLYALCIKSVANQLAAICETKPTLIPLSIGQKPAGQLVDDPDDFTEANLYSFRDKTIKLNDQISQDLLAQLCQTGQLTNLTIGVFTKAQTNLRNVTIKRATLNLQVLRYVLLQHNILQFSLDNMQVESINQVIECLNQWSWAHLKSLTISHCKWRSAGLDKLARFGQVRNLNMSYTMLSNEQLEAVTRLLPALEMLDISFTYVDDVSPLQRLGATLRHLKMFNMFKKLGDTIIEPICSLRRLQKLDLSSNRFRDIDVTEEYQGFDANLFLDSLAKARLTELTYLDISAWVNVKEEKVCQLVRAYPKLKFLGLALVNTAAIDLQAELLNMLSRFTGQARVAPVLSTFKPTQVAQINPDLRITGELNHRQLADSLRAYMPREFYSVITMIHLFWQTVDITEANLELVRLVLEHLDAHIDSMTIVWVGTFCLLNLTRNRLIIELADVLLTPFLAMTLKIMKHHSTNRVILKNCFLLSHKVEAYFVPKPKETATSSSQQDGGGGAEPSA